MRSNSLSKGTFKYNAKNLIQPISCNTFNLDELVSYGGQCFKIIEIYTKLNTCAGFKRYTYLCVHCNSGYRTMLDEFEIKGVSYDEFERGK